MSQKSFSKIISNLIRTNESLLLSGSEIDEDFLSSLSYLSSYYTPNINLRGVLEKKNLHSYSLIMNKFNDVYMKYEKIKNLVDGIGEKADVLEKELKIHENITRKFLSRVDVIKEKRVRCVKKKEMIMEFLEKYQLNDKERKVLISGNLENEEFFLILNKVYDIQMECKKMIRNEKVKTQKAPLEILNEMSMYQNAAYDRLSRWIQQKCHYSDSFFEEKLKMAIQTLFERPVLLKSCIDEIVEARKNFLIQDFFEALTLKQNPIQVRAHDTVRYLGDILAWIHQHIAYEKEMIKSLINIDEKLDSDEKKLKKRELINNMTNETIKVLSQPLTNNLQQILQHNSDEKIYFKLSHLLEFYSLSIAKFLSDDAKFPKFMLELRDLCVKEFYKALNIDINNFLLLKETYAIKDDLTPPKNIDDYLSKLSDIMGTYNESFISKERKGEDFNKVIDTFIDPLLDLINNIVKKHEKLSLSDSQIFLINCYCQVLQCLNEFSEKINKKNEVLSNELETIKKQFITQQSALIINKFGFVEKLKIIKEGGQFEISEITSFIAKFYSSLYEFGSQHFTPYNVDKIEELKLKNSIRSKILLALLNSYEVTYKFICEKFDNHDEIVYHTPEKIKKLLEI